MNEPHPLIDSILNKKLNILNLFYLALMSVLFGFDAFLKLVKSSYKETGSFNFIIGFVILGLHAFFYFIYHYRFKSNRIKKEEVWSVFIGFLLLTILLGNSLGYIELGKVIRDVFYTFFFIILFYFILYFKESHNNSFTSVLKLSFFIYFIVFNIIGLVLGNFDHEGRFTGMQMAASIYGGCVCLFLIILLESDLSKFFKYFYFLVGFPFLLLSGTRGAVLSLIVYFSFSFYRKFAKNKLLQFVIISILLTIVGLIIIKLDEILAAMSALSSIRFASTEDLEGGSLGTRLTWYLMIFSDLYNDSFIGGFGAGAAEKLTGHITHFDLLRFWYDYSLGFILVQLLLFFYMIKSTNKNSLLIFLYFFVQYVLFSLHNIFQAPTMLFLFALSLVVLTSKTEQVYGKV